MLKEIVVLFLAFLGILALTLLTGLGPYGFILWTGLVLIVFFILFAYYEWSLNYYAKKQRHKR